jgi:hypothetical protein
LIWRQVGNSFGDFFDFHVAQYSTGWKSCPHHVALSTEFHAGRALPYTLHHIVVRQAAIVVGTPGSSSRKREAMPRVLNECSAEIDGAYGRPQRGTESTAAQPWAATSFKLRRTSIERTPMLPFATWMLRLI